MTSERRSSNLTSASDRSIGEDNSSRSAGIVAAVLLFVATGAVFLPLLQQPEGILVGIQNGGRNDVTGQFAAVRSTAAVTRERDGQLPWWNPSLLCGAPVLGNPQAALFYPPNWLFLIWRNPSAVGWMMVFHHWLAGLGTYFLCRKYGFAFVPSLVGAVCFLAAPYYVAQCGEGHFNQICVMAWVPWSFLAFERFRAERNGGVLLVALTFAFSLLAGHAQESYYSGIILSVFVVIDGIRLWRIGEVGTAWLRIGRWFGVAIAAVGLIAFELLPVALYSRMSVRSGGMSSEMASAISLNLSHLWQLINPAVNGGTGAGPLYWETLCYFGLVPLSLAVFGAIVGWKKYPTARFVGLWLVALTFAFGASLPVFPVLHRLIPGLALFRVPSRAIFFCSFAGAVLAAGGTNTIWQLADEKMGRDNRTLRAVCLSGILISVLLVVGAASGLIAETELKPWSVALSNNLGGFVLALLCFSLIWIGCANRRWRLASGSGLLLLCVIEVSTYSQRILQVQPISIVNARYQLTDELLQNAGHHRVLASQADWSDYCAIQFGVQKLQGYEPVPLQDYAAAFDALTPDRDPMKLVLGFDPIDIGQFDKSVLDLLGVRYLLTSSQQTIDRHSWRLVARGRGMASSVSDEEAHDQGVAMYENRSAMPRAFVVGRAIESPTSGRAAVEALRTLDIRNEILLNRDVLPSGPRADFQVAEITKYSANRVDISVETKRPGYLFLSDVWYPGWSAEVDGNRADVSRANLAFRAVALMPGRHRVTFQYQPRGLFLGCLISLLTAGILISGLLPSRSAPTDIVGEQKTAADCASKAPSNWSVTSEK